MRLNIAVPEERVNKPILDAALESVTRLNEELLKSGELPPLKEVVHRVRWKPEPPGAEHFDHGARVLARGWGDCDDLAPWHAASLRVAGVDRGAKAVVKKSGPKRWHAYVERSNGKIEDPSLTAGMRGPRGVRAATLAEMAKLSGVNGAAPPMPLVALRPVLGPDGRIRSWDARADMPWAQGPGVAFSSLNRAHGARAAVVGALRGGSRVCELSGIVGDEVVDCAGALADAICGADYDELEEEYGEDHAEAAMEGLVGFWDTLADVASKAVSFVPGIGPVASMAIDAGKNIAKGEIEKSQRKNAAKAAAAAARKKAARKTSSAAKVKAKREASRSAPGGGRIFPRAEMRDGNIFFFAG